MRIVSHITAYIVCFMLAAPQISSNFDVKKPRAASLRALYMATRVLTHHLTSEMLGCCLSNRRRPPPNIGTPSLGVALIISASIIEIYRSTSRST